MDDDKHIKLLETFTAVVIGLLSKIAVKLAKRDPADRFLTNVVLLHILILISVVLISYIFSMFVR